MLTRFSTLKSRWQLCWFEQFYAFYLLLHSIAVNEAYCYDDNILNVIYFKLLRCYVTVVLYNTFVCESYCLFLLILCTYAPPVRDIREHILLVHTGHDNALFIAGSSNCIRQLHWQLHMFILNVTGILRQRADCMPAILHAAV